jgi:WD40 repeat protein
MRTARSKVAVVLVISTGFLAACQDATTPEPVRKIGGIAVSVVTSGPDPDEDGYNVTLNGAVKPAGELEPNGSLTLSAMPSGNYQIRLAGLAQNCTVDGSNPRTVTVVFGEITTAAFAVRCAAVGTVQITTTTSGSPADPDGYIVRAEGSGSSGTSVFLPAEGTANIRLAPGGYTVSLLGVSGNCNATVPDEATTREISVVPGTAIAISFAVKCDPVSVTQLAFVRDGRIYKVNADGTGLTRLTDGPADGSPAWSPDWRHIAFVRSSGRKDEWGGEFRDIYVMDANGSHLRLLADVWYYGRPAWSPDGREIAFSSRCDVQGCIQVVSADGNGQDVTRLGFERGWHESPAWSPDGAAIAFASDWVMFDDASDIFVTTRDGRRITQLTSGRGSRSTDWFGDPAWSPNGRKLAVVTNTCGQSCAGGIAVMNADGSGLTTLTTGSVSSPTWSPDGSMIAYSVHFGPTAWIEWFSADGSKTGVIVADGHSPAWRR